MNQPYAIGSPRELLEYQTAIIDANPAFALEQYNLATRDLLVPSSYRAEQGVDVCLILCCFEIHPLLYMVVVS